MELETHHDLRPVSTLPKCVWLCQQTCQQTWNASATRNRTPPTRHPANPPTRQPATPFIAGLVGHWLRSVSSLSRWACPLHCRNTKTIQSNHNQTKQQTQQKPPNKKNTTTKTRTQGKFQLRPPAAPYCPVPRVKIHTRGNIWSFTVGWHECCDPTGAAGPLCIVPWYALCNVLI